MDTIFVTASTPESQAYTRLILATHVLYRGFQSGALLGPPIALVRTILSARKLETFSVAFRSAIGPNILRSTGSAGLVGVGLLTVGLEARMWGRSELEWKERGWRLLRNKGQNEWDVWSVSGMVGGLGALGAVNQGFAGLGWRAVLGGMGLGGWGGILGYMGWTYARGGRKRDG